MNLETPAFKRPGIYRRPGIY